MIIKKQLALIKKFRALFWSVWLKREFPVLVAYSMIKNASKTAFAKQGIDGQWPICLFEGNAWRGNQKMFTLAGREAKKYLRKTDAYFLVKVCEDGRRRALVEIGKMNQDKKMSPLKQYQKVISLLEPVNVSIWTAHASEVYYLQELKKKLAKYIAPENVEKFINDVGFPVKKNAHAMMIEDILDGIPTRILYKKYSWLKSRIDAGFANGYSIKEISDLKKNILKNPPTPVVCPPVPGNLKKLVEQFQEIVYLRTLRTDALFEVYFRARPIFARVEKYFGVDSVKHYVPDDLLKGKVERYAGHFAILKYYDQILVTKEKIALDAASATGDVKGVVAFMGKAVGRVKIVFRPSEIGKVNEGDILVTNMTIPAYLLGMRKAAGIVTDEGGITCHAAILSRELRKPCVIGTKIATKIFKDGDMVEVDAEKGIVRKI